MKQYDEALALLDTAEAEGFYGTNLIWDRIWAMCFGSLGYRLGGMG